MQNTITILQKIVSKDTLKKFLSEYLTKGMTLSHADFNTLASNFNLGQKIQFTVDNNTFTTTSQNYTHAHIHEKQLTIYNDSIEFEKPLFNPIVKIKRTTIGVNYFSVKLNITTDDISFNIYLYLH